MSERPWLSVLMPTYNGASYVAAALESVRAEARDDVEVLVADDGSDDDTLAIVSAYASQLTLRVVSRRRVGNWIAGTNALLGEARGRYACFLHQDDLWLPGRVGTIRRALEAAPEATWVVAPAVFVDSGGRRVGDWGTPFRGDHGLVSSRAFTEHLLVQNFLAIPAPVFDLRVALRAGRLDEALWYTADWDFWLKLASSGPALVLRTPLAAFRVHLASQTMAPHRTRGDFESQLRLVLERHFPRWAADAPPRRRVAVREAAELSIAVNTALAGGARGEGVPWMALARQGLRLGPAGLYRYGRDSRIVERVAARYRLRKRT